MMAKVTPTTTDVPAAKAPDKYHQFLATERSGSGATDATQTDVVNQPVEKTGPPSPPSMGAKRRDFVMLGLLISTLTMAFDGTIIVTAIPRITNEFHSVNDVGWYGSIYYIGVVIFQPIIGKLFFQFHERYVYLATLLLFEVGSIICATAKHSYVLIIGRAIAGCGGAGMFSGAMILGSMIATPQRRQMHMALISCIFGIGCAVGPLLGGAFTASIVTWRFSFWLNLPLGALMCPSLMAYKPSQQKQPPSFATTVKLLDLPGTFLITSTLLLLLIPLQWGGIQYAWSNSRVIGCLVGCGVGAVLFVVYHTLIAPGGFQRSPFRVLKNRTVAAASLTALFFSAAARAQVYYLPIYLQIAQGASSVQSGIYMIPYLGVMATASIISGIVTARVGWYQPSMWTGGSLFVIGSGLLFAVQTSSSLGYVIGVQVLIGFGSGMLMHTGITAVQSAVSPPEIPLASAMIGFMIAFGPSISIGLVQNVFLNRLSEGLARNGLSPNLVRGVAAIVDPATIETSLRQPAAAARYNAAYVFALQQVFLVCLILSALSLICSFGVKLQRIAKR